MTNLATLAEELYMLGAALDEATEALIEADAHTVEAEQAYKMAYAKAFLEATGAVAQKEHVAMIATETERWNLEVAKQIFRAAKSKADAIRTHIDVGRSLSAMTRSEMALGGFVA